jgi:eukaryotic-like serine/threonine-protein kinase
MKICPVCGKEFSDTSRLCPLDAAVLQQTKEPLIGETLAGKYSIEKLIKHGGMGSVFVGKHVLMDKTVAIKVLRPSLALDNDVVARFSREAKAASRISHPHAVSVTDFGEDEKGVVFLVMEYLDGLTLKEVIKAEGPMALDRAVEIIRQVAGALDAAHEQGVVHRDLKSDNVMLSQTNGGDWAKVLDFGIAKIQTDGVRDIDITAPNLVIGTPQYMSPEQCHQSGPLDARSDIYSLGVIIFEMLAGRVPFTGESPTVIMMKQVQDDPPSISESRPDLPVAVGAVLDRALAKKPSDRFRSAGELSAAFTEAAIATSPAAPEAAVIAAPTTVPIAPVATLPDRDEITMVRPTNDDDEATIVRPREEPLRHEPPPAPLLRPEQAAIAGMNPWRIIVPAAIVLIVVFAAVFLMTRGTNPTGSPNANVSNEPGVVPDPNSQPVQPAGTPTGDNERNIQSQPMTTPTPRAVEANANVSEPARVNGNFGANENSNSSNSNRNSNRNTNQSASPRPTVKPPEEEPPPPKATPTVRELPKTSASPIGQK